MKGCIAFYACSHAQEKEIQLIFDDIVSHIFDERSSITNTVIKMMSWSASEL